MAKVAILVAVSILLLLVRAGAAFNCSGSITVQYSPPAWVRTISIPTTGRGTTSWAGDRYMPSYGCAGRHAIDGKWICCATRQNLRTHVCWNMETKQVYTKSLTVSATTATHVALVANAGHYLFTSNTTAAEHALSAVAARPDSPADVTPPTASDSVVYSFTALATYESPTHSFVFVGHTSGLFELVWSRGDVLPTFSAKLAISGVARVQSLAVSGSTLYVQVNAGDLQLRAYQIDALATQSPVLTLITTPQPTIPLSTTTTYSSPTFASAPNCPDAILVHATYVDGAGTQRSRVLYVDPKNSSAPFQTAFSPAGLIPSWAMSPIMPDYVPPGAPKCRDPIPMPDSFFYCNYTTLEWTSKAPIVAPTWIGTGNVSITGDFNISSTTTFSGIGTKIVVDGCINLAQPNILLELNENFIKLLEGSLDASKTFRQPLLSHTCNSGASQNLSSISVMPRTTGCKSVKATIAPESTSKALISILSVSDNCGPPGNKGNSKTWWIVLVSVLGAVVVLCIIGAAIIWHMQKKKLGKKHPGS